MNKKIPAGEPLSIFRYGQGLLPSQSRRRHSLGQCMKLRFSVSDFIFHLAQPPLLVAIRRGDPGSRITLIVGASVLRNAVEVGEELVILLLRDRVEFVVMTARAAHC